ncbi:MAG: type II toxin-antitoxin system HicA family toxin [Candidatus Sumerlaeota bacterium]|nr:type II toxin-antitoxin system HicA family toxin [Candidatus Sumerlaeota bacterium]
MSPFLPQIKAKDLVRVVVRLGFELDRQSGSHAVYYRASDKARVVIPIHVGRDIKPKTLYGIIDDLKLTPTQFKELL